MAARGGPRAKPLETAENGTAGRFDRHELEALFVRMEKRVFNVVYRWVWDREEAAEVTQEAFLKLWRMKERVVPETVEPLLFRIAVNAASNRRRSRRMKAWLGFTDSAGVTPAPGTGEDDARVRAAVEALPEKLRAVAVLTELSEMAYAEVAEALGIPIGTVASRRSAAMARLKTMLEAG